MQYMLMVDGEIIKCVPVVKIIRQKCKEFLDAQLSDNVFIDVSGYYIPDNIFELLTRRLPRIQYFMHEHEDYIRYSKLLSLFGSKCPTKVNTLNIVSVPKNFEGTFDIPDNTDILRAYDCPNLIGFTGMAPLMFLQRSGITGLLDIPDGVTYINLSYCRLLTGITGGATSVMLKHSSIKGNVHIEPGTRFFDASFCNHMTSFTGSATSISMEWSGLQGDVIVPNVDYFNCDCCSSVTSISGGARIMNICNTNIKGTLHVSDCVEYLYMSHTDVSRVIGGVKSMVVHKYTRV